MDAKEIVVGGDVLELKDAEARNLLGSETLDTEATTVTGAINELNSNLTPEVFNMVSTGLVTIEFQSCYKIGKIAVVKLTAKANQNITNAQIINFPSNIRTSQAGSVFISGQGDRWDISNFIYTYLANGGFTIRSLTANTYIHIDTVIVLS